MPAKKQLEVHQTEVRETVMEKGDVIVSIYEWGNMEGATVVMDHKRSSLIAANLTHEELDLLVAAIAAARVG